MEVIGPGSMTLLGVVLINLLTNHLAPSFAALLAGGMIHGFVNAARPLGSVKKTGLCKQYMYRLPACVIAHGSGARV